jgi:two-component sensor histidine kinase
MKPGGLLKKIVYSTWFLAAIPAIIVIWLMPSIGTKYKLDVVQAENMDKNNYYADLNSDSISEIVSFSRGFPYYFIAVKNLDHNFYDQWNITDSVSPKMSQPFFGNCDHNRFEEIYVFSFMRDSLFLNVNEMLPAGAAKARRLFMFRIGYLNGVGTGAILPAGFYDDNSDGTDELYFTFSSIFRLGPRATYRYDFVNKSLTSSPLAHSAILEPKLYDADGDKKPEIFGTSSGSGNYPSNVAYSDSSSWFIVLDSRLNFKFPPVEFKGFANGLSTMAYKGINFRGYAVAYLANGVDTAAPKSQITLYSADGKLVRSRLLSDLGVKGHTSFFVRKSYPFDKIYIIYDKFLELNDSLDVIRSVDLPFKRQYVLYADDVDGNGEDEYLFYLNQDRKLLIYSADFHKLSESDFDVSDQNVRISHFLDKDHSYKLYITTGDRAYFIRFFRNPLYPAGFLIHPGIYFSFYFFIIIIKKIGTSQQKAREQLNNRLITLQLQGIKAQLDPHFTFNTLNSIASLIYLEDRQTAYDYMHKFTELLRSMLNDAEKIYRNLGDEIEFVTTYLELEKLRFGQKFSYVIELGEGIDLRVKVPKLVLQTFAENAVKHGLMPAESGGLITLRVSRENEYIRLCIEDNGIGRAKSAGQSNSTGKGLKLTSEFYEILNQLNKKPIRYHITDLYDSSHTASGTRVEVWVPIGEL